MGLFKNTYEYQEILVYSFEDIKTIVDDYNHFYKLPRCGCGDKNDSDTYLKSFFRGQLDSIWDITPSVERSKKKNMRY